MDTFDVYYKLEVSVVAFSETLAQQIQSIFGQMLEQSSFVWVASSGGGIDRKTGEELSHVFYESSDRRIQFYRADGEANILVGPKSAELKPGPSPEWQYLRTALNYPERSLEELLTLVPDSPLSTIQQLQELRPLLAKLLSRKV